MTPTPELDKLSKVREKSQAVGEFLDWLAEEKRIVFSVHHEHDEECRNSNGSRICGLNNYELVPTHFTHERILAEFFGIDLNKVEQERRALLDEIRAVQTRVDQVKRGGLLMSRERPKTETKSRGHKGKCLFKYDSTVTTSVGSVRTLRCSICGRTKEIRLF